MNEFFKKYGVLLLIAVLAWRAFVQYKHIGPENQVLRADGKGYYAYLPALFIYHDGQMNFIDYYEHKYNPPEAYADFRNKDNGRYVDKYFAGVAILQLPFFLCAHAVSYLLHLPTDGYAPLYQQFFVAGALFYLFLGMQFFFLYLIAWKVRPWQAWLVIAMILLGTNAWHYTVYEQCMSHLYSLSMFGLFIYGTYRIIHTQSKKWLVISLFIFGMIVVLRPVNMVILAFVPFVAGSWPNLKNGIMFVLRSYASLAIGMLLALLPVVIQSLLWHWQTGKFLVYSYGTEGMEWANPKIFHILFSYRKGWFVWTPLAFIGVFGLFLSLKDWFRFFSISLFLLLVIYILSCWWTPDYGMGFGAREFIEFLFVPAIGLALILKRSKHWLLRIGFIIICLFGVYVNLVQEKQYRYHIILWDGMDKTDYWRVFLRNSPGYYYFLEERAGFVRPTLINTKVDKSFTHAFEHAQGWRNDDNVTKVEVHSGTWANYINNKHEVGAIFTYPIDSSIMQKDSLVQASIWFNGPQPDFTRLVIQFVKDNKEVARSFERLRKFADHNFSWNQAIVQAPIPKDLPKGSIVNVYIDNTYNTETFYLDDFRIDFIKK